MGEGTGGERPRPPTWAEGAFGRAIAPVLAALGGNPDRGSLRQAFARALLRRTPPGQLAAAAPGPVAAAIDDIFAFVDTRPTSDVRVRLVDGDVALDGWRALGTLVEVNCEDRQFIVSTVREELHRLGFKVVRDIHPVYGCERGPDGRLVAVVPARTAVHRESFLQAELGSHVAVEARARVIDAVGAVLADVFAATGDYAAMRRRVGQAADRARAFAGLRFPIDEVGETGDLLEWLLDGNFVLSGCCRLPHGDGPAVDGLGVLSRPGAPLRDAGFDGAGPDQLLRVTRTAEISTVHRQVPMHCIDVAEVGPHGEPEGAFRVVGVFTHKANAEPSVVTPVLRFKLRRILDLEDVVEGSQDEVGLQSLFQVLPKDELFQADVPSLRRTLMELLAAEQAHDVRVLLRAEPASATVSVLLSVPDELYTPALRHRVEAFLLAQLDGTGVEADVALGDRPEAILRLVVHVDSALAEPDVDALSRELRLLCRTWDEELATALQARVGADGPRLAHAWGEWFPATYRDAVAPAAAVDDVLSLDALVAGTGPGPAPDVLVVLIADDDAPGRSRLKVFASGRGVELSRFLPILESLGLWALEDRPFTLGAGARTVHLHDFGVIAPPGTALDAGRDGRRLADAAVALWHGQAEVDPLNRLVLRAGMSWDDVAVLRAYRRYRSQVGSAFSSGYLDQVLVDNPVVARSLVELFAARFDPGRADDADAVAERRGKALAGCDAVARLDHDRILRGVLALVDATLRTNRYTRGGPHLALKLDCAAVPDMPRPVPYREIFVHGPAVEGVHLRWGPVARGGIRWSDRPDDYRREVLDLMRAQVLKNAVIVPTGAKGGFVVKAPAHAAAPVDVRGAYETFITSLLEVTDNVVGEAAVPVTGRADGDDPYLVVAADRGTATFSDLANAISRRRGFWLGDAFASGGSSGYDHKGLGITARGAWVAVRHHFAQLDIDLDTEPVTVVGIGDMSGDVFGNAMLRSDRIRLVAAFDHRDIFLDPDPDPAASYAERARLFALAGSSWQDYDRARISPGGGVWSRLVKRIEVSEGVRAVLRVDTAELTPAELVRAILQAPVGLLFAGGIGTFVRAATEPDHEIDDRLNSEVRVEGHSLRARVVGEGANLAFTQRARIEYARRGGHINTDAIDNAAAVDLSDHEVNLKILLRLAERDNPGLTGDERDGLLAEVGDEVVAAVLHDCALQSVLLTRSQVASAAGMDAMENLMVELEAGGVVDRTVEALPTTTEMRARAQAGAGLTRPELAVLVAGAKRSLAARLLASDVVDEPALREALVSYFPARLATRFDHLLERHHLRRELVASVMANDLVNRMGATFVTRLAADAGVRPDAVAAAYWVARGVAGTAFWWAEIDAGCGPVGGVVASATVVSGLLEALARAYIRRGETAGIAAVVARDRAPFVALAADMAGIGSPSRRRLRARRAERLVESGVDPAHATSWAGLSDLDVAPDAADLARRTGRSVGGAAEVILQVGESLGIDRLVERLAAAKPADRWARAAWRGLVDDLDDLRRLAARRALEDHPGQAEPDAVIGFLAARTDRVAAVSRLLREVESEPEPRLDAVTVATRAVRRAIG